MRISEGVEKVYPMAKKRESAPKQHPTYGFGVPKDTLAPHHFIVEIPRTTRGKGSDVLIMEDLGMQSENSDSTVLDRVLIPRPYWTEISGPVKRTFNERLKAHNLRTSVWKAGRNAVDRMLGKELCVLAWAIEDLESSRVGTALRNWLGLRPEERWWLFGMVSETVQGLNDKECGWRIALRYALGHSQEANLNLARKDSKGQQSRSNKKIKLPIADKDERDD